MLELITLGASGKFVLNMYILLLHVSEQNLETRVLVSIGRFAVCSLQFAGE